MTGPAIRNDGFSFTQLSRIVDAFEGKTEEPKVSGEKSSGETVLSAAEDSVDVGGKAEDVVIIPGKGMRVQAKDSMGAVSSLCEDEQSEKRPDISDVTGDLEKKGINVDKKFDRLSAVTAKIDPEKAKELKDQGYLVMDNSPRCFVPDTPRVCQTNKGKEVANPWAMPQIDDLKWTGTDKLHEQGLTGKGSTIAILDSGYQHPQRPLKAWADFVEGSPSPVDPNGHGTHVAGDAVKMAPDADIVAIRVMNEKGQGRPDLIFEGINWAIANKQKHDIDVLNMSLGFPASPGQLLEEKAAIGQAIDIATMSGITVVAAAGNAGPEPATIGCPGDSESVITVGSALNPEYISEFSSRGPGEKGNAKPDIIAPGEYISSWNVPMSKMDRVASTAQKIREMRPKQIRNLFETAPMLLDALGIPKQILAFNNKELAFATKMNLPAMFKPDKDTLAGPGTSFASPEVSGMVADLEQANPKAGPWAIKESLTATAQKMDAADYETTDQGAGFVQADKAKEYLEKEMGTQPKN